MESAQSPKRRVIKEFESSACDGTISNGRLPLGSINSAMHRLSEVNGRASERSTRCVQESPQFGGNVARGRPRRRREDEGSRYLHPGVPPKIGGTTQGSRQRCALTLRPVSPRIVRSLIRSRYLPEYETIRTYCQYNYVTY